jgi:hypothetical protein
MLQCLSRASYNLNFFLNFTPAPVYPRLALSSQSSCLTLPSARITDVTTIPGSDAVLSAVQILIHYFS